MNQEWKNKLFCGDNLGIMREHIPDESMDVLRPESCSKTSKGDRELRIGQTTRSVALIYNDFRREEAAAANPVGVHQMETTVEAVRTALAAAGHSVQEIQLGSQPDPSLLYDCPAEVAFNLTTGIVNKMMQLHVVALIEMAGINFIGSGLRTQVACLDKTITKALLIREGIPTARSRTIRNMGDFDLPGQDIPFPAIVKPSMLGSSLGITQDSVVRTPRQLRIQVGRVLREFRQPVLVEQFLPGREFTVGIIGNQDARVFPLQEIVYADGPDEGAPISTFEAALEDHADHAECPVQIDEALLRQIEGIALAAYRLLGMKDLARIDVRLNKEGRPQILEVNALPGLEPGYSAYPLMAEAGGWPYEVLIDYLVQACAAPQSPVYDRRPGR